MADKDTRRFYNWGSKYRSKDNDSNAKEIGEGDEICLFTDPRDNQYNYEGFNLLIACKDAQTFKDKTPDSSGTYGEPKGLEVCKCGRKE